MHRQLPETRRQREPEQPQPPRTQLHFQDAHRTLGPGRQPSRRAAHVEFSGFAAAAATLADAGEGGFGTDETQALGKAKAGLEMGEVRIVVEAGAIVGVEVGYDEGAADDVEKVERAQLRSERRQFRIGELADTVEG